MAKRTARKLKKKVGKTAATPAPEPHGIDEDVTQTLQLGRRRGEPRKKQLRRQKSNGAHLARD